MILQAEYVKKSKSKLETVITIMSRPVRIVKGHEVSESVDESLFQEAEERELYTAAKAAAAEVDEDMSIPSFLEVCMASTAYFRHMHLPSMFISRNTTSH